ncbi:transmembrane protein, putative (macronuclear) [Tetrahymena thermophila SB210]|uniref:Transmembrane protein, putative n=1 Tax=Tetrahymena thermophila (strain SB210) TaxID=312017 RepID=I7LZH3_TETTS|nr:transmembrane protein, putative [Tetrahymena thermophila SB210]EAR83934.2 transmembrane protein, putative [Tetrahymena thermophila SB210]|eukprot:XP_001031597.2 transmembrane protein, putative [Tetrahymena thermophila SB210]
MNERPILSADQINDSDILYSYDISEQIEIELSSYQKGKWWMQLINGFHLMFMIFIFVEAWITFQMNCNKSKQRRQIYKLIGICCFAQIVFMIFFIISLQQNVYCSNAICHPYFNGKWLLSTSDFSSEAQQHECNSVQQQFDSKLEISQAIQTFVKTAAYQYCQNQLSQNPENSDDKNNCDTLNQYQIEVEYSKVFFLGTIVMTIFEMSYLIVVVYIIKKLKYLQVKRGISQINEQNDSNDSLHHSNYY